jgi:hypothetical protein
MNLSSMGLDLLGIAAVILTPFLAFLVVACARFFWGLGTCYKLEALGNKAAQGK